MTYRHRWWASGWGQISSLPCVSSPAPVPTETPEEREPRTGVYGGLICSHPSISRPGGQAGGAGRGSRGEGPGLSVPDAGLKTSLF